MTMRIAILDDWQGVALNAADWYCLGPEAEITVFKDPFPGETAVAAASLIFGGVLDEFPRLLIYLAHGGGSCPYLHGRWEHGWRVREDIRKAIEKPPSEYFKLLYFDSLVHSGAALNYLEESVGPARIMLGTDYPFDMGDHDPLKSLASLSHLSDGQREPILSGNAAALLKITLPSQPLSLIVSL